MAAIATVGAAGLGAVLALGVSTSAATGAATVVLSAFEVLQIVEIVAMVDFKCPEKLDQFLQAFEFLKLQLPQDINFVFK